MPEKKKSIQIAINVHNKALLLSIPKETLCMKHKDYCGLQELTLWIVIINFNLFSSFFGPLCIIKQTLAQAEHLGVTGEERFEQSRPRAIQNFSCGNIYIFFRYHVLIPHLSLSSLYSMSCSLLSSQQRAAMLFLESKSSNLHALVWLAVSEIKTSLLFLSALS